MNNIKIISVVGARPNFIKIAPFIREIKRNKKIKHILVHTGQHYDDRMSSDFFKTLNIPNADINLGIGSGGHSEQVGKTMISFEKILNKEKPDWVVVVGDVNATLACSIAAKKLDIKVCHIEAGLRSYDMAMPEEINRIVTDRISDLLLVPDKLSVSNLLKEGVSDNKIKFVGNIMIDTLDVNYNFANKLKLSEIISNNSINGGSISIKKDESFGVVTLHRPSNVDFKKILSPIIDFLINDVSQDMKLIWPVHPRTLKKLKSFSLLNKLSNHNKIVLLHPLNYHQMLKLNIESKIIFTDSGGIQEECTILGTRCLTLRDNTERPITLYDNKGPSILVGNDVRKIKKGYCEILKNKFTPFRPELWDGETAARCVKAIMNC